MRLAVLIDYANFYISIKKITGLKLSEDIEERACSIINSMCSYLEKPNEYYKKGIKILVKKAYVLDYSSFGTPENRLPNEGMEIQRVECSGKTDEMKDMNQSQLDDEILMQEGIRLAQNDEVDGILLISNDGDFAALGEKLNYVGRAFWVGLYEGKNIRAASKLKRQADLVLPLQEIASGIDEGVALPILEEITDNIDSINGPHVNIYKNGKVIMTYPLDKDIVDIGRRSSSRFHFPQIDLTDFDTEHITSRQHATIRKVKDRFILLVDEMCTRGTWVNRKPVYPYEQIVLNENMEIVIGESNGFGIEFLDL